MVEKDVYIRNKLPPIHPGEVLAEEFLSPMNITQYRLAKAIGVDPRRIHAIVHGQRAITAETALLFSRFFGNSARFWMGLQTSTTLRVRRIASPPDLISSLPTHREQVGECSGTVSQPAVQ